MTVTNQLTVGLDERNERFVDDLKSRLLRALSDLSIFGDVVDAASSGGAVRFTYRLAPRGKVTRAMALADDVAIGMVVPAVRINDAGDRSLRIVVLPAPYFVSTVSGPPPAIAAFR